MASATASKASTELQDLIAFFPEVIGKMPNDTFTSHEFILVLGNRYQEQYVRALCRYSTKKTPFKNLHSQISIALAELPNLLEQLEDVKSEDIFRRLRKCANWRKKS